MASISKRTIRWETKDGQLRVTERWQAQYKDRAGRRHRRLFDLRRDAQTWLDEQTTGLVTGQWADPRAGKETLQAYAERWRKRQVHADNTTTSYEGILRLHVYPSLGGMRLDSITPADVQALVKKWSDTAAPTTVEARYSVLAIVLRAAVRERVLPSTPCIDIKLPRIAAKAALVPVTTGIVRALHDAMPERYRAFVLVGAGTGMRRGELLGLTIDRVGMDFGTIRVDRQLAKTSSGDTVMFASPKTEASVRTIDVAPIVVDAIRRHVDRFGFHHSGLIFTSEIGTPLRASTLHRAWSIAAREVGTDVTPHDLRHYFASVQIAAGTSIKKLQHQLGHKSATETWDTYGHLLGDEDDRARAAIQNALGNLGHSTGTVAGG